jgi:hypothetical protein
MTVIRVARFSNKNTKLVEFWRALDWKMFICVWPFGIFTDIRDIL